MNEQRLPLIAGTILVLALLGLTAVFFTSGEPAPMPEPPAPAPKASKPAANRVALPALSPEPEGWSSRAYEEAAPGKPTIRCSSLGIVPDGAYQVFGGPVIFPVAQGGVFTAAVGEVQGAATLTQRLQPVATVRWEGATEGTVSCTVEALEHVTVSGKVVDGDGKPVADVMIRGCDHGEIVLSDEDGQFALSAPKGAECHPMAFIEHDDGSLSKGSFAELLNVDGDVDDLILTVPDLEDALSEDQLRAMAEQLATMTEQMLAPRQAEIDRLQELYDSGELEIEDQVRLRTHLAAEQELADRMVEQTELLRDPENQVRTIRDAWLNQY